MSIFMTKSTRKKNKLKLKSKLFMIVSGLLVLGMVLFAFNSLTKKNHPSFTDQPSAYNGLSFSLQSDQGQVSLKDFAGKRVYLYLGYTFCPDICPTNLGNLSLAYQQLTLKEKEAIQIIFVSVDPDRDTPKRLAQYAGYFDMNMLGLTGTPTQLKALAKDLGAAFVVNKQEGKHYSVDHSAFTYLINPKGKLIKMFPHGTTPKLFLQSFQNTSVK